MSKRTPGLPQRPRGFWPTPRDAARPLIPYLPVAASYIEPCAGAGDLVRHLADLWPGGRCVFASDMEPQAGGIARADALDIVSRPDLFITNPPWPVGGKRGDPALSIIVHLMGLAPSWMLLPWDFAANVYFGEVRNACVSVVPIGRVSWMGNGTPGKDNAAWYLFDACHSAGPILHRRSL